MKYDNILANFKIDKLNEMQEEAMKSITGPGDVILHSPTGSGKTLAFLLPLLQLLDEKKQGVQALILVPSRELALQIEQVFKQMGTGLKVNCCYGGHSVRIEKNNLAQPPAVLVGTPGKIAFHIRNLNFALGSVQTLVLDEFDKSLELGFKDEMSFIVNAVANVKKRILTSATKMEEIPSFVRLKPGYAEIDYTNDVEPTNAGLELKTVHVKDLDKTETLLLLLSKLGAPAKIVFCNHRDAVKRLSAHLTHVGVANDIYHGEMEQQDRERAIIKLRNGTTNVLITTDLAARGLDIPEIKSIIHYQLPFTEDSLIHRNGRTARMNAGGTAYFILDKEEWLPKFVTEPTTEEDVPEDFSIPPASEWKTLYIASGKKDKINKMDIVGFLLQKGGIEKDDLGKIEVLDHAAYAAVKSDKIDTMLRKIKEEKIKNKKVKFNISE